MQQQQLPTPLAGLQAISSPGAPAALGHYSPALCWHHQVHLAGQLPMDPLDPERIRPNSPFEAQMQQLLSNCAALLQAAGSSPQAVLSLTVYLDDLAHWDEMDRCCAAFFASHRPARTVLGVAAIRKGYAVQASLVAARP